MNTNIYSNNNPALKEPSTMKDLLQDKNNLIVLPKVGDILEGRVIEKGRNRLFLDLDAFRAGVIYKSEIDTSLYNLHDIKEDDVLTVKVLDLENKDGFMELSLKEAGIDKAWGKIRELKESGETLEVKILEANRGGLVTQINSLTAFLPVSQLSSANYPRVEGGDKDEILKSLKKFIGQSLVIKILDFDQKSAKLILSEKAKTSQEIQTKLAQYHIGDVIEGEISGLVDFGAFVTFNGIEGLIHISEIAWQLVENPADMLSIGQKISAKIIGLEGDKVSLSLKALKPNPWDEVEKKYKKGTVVTGTVVKFNPFGAFVKIDSEIQGLAHVSEFKTFKEMTNMLELNKSYPFKITSLEPKEYKMALRPIIEGKESEEEKE